VKPITEPPNKYAHFVDRTPEGVITSVALIYVFLFLNQHFTRFTVWFPVLLLILWLIGYKKEIHNNVRAVFTLLPRRLWLALVSYLASILLASLNSPFRGAAVEELLQVLVGPLLIAIIAGQTMQREGVERLLVLALVWGGGFLAATDVVTYIRDFATLGQFPRDFSHRWFSDGYIFYLPLLFLYRDTLAGRGRVLFNAGLFLIFLLVAGTGSRSAWGTILIEIVLLWALTRQRHYLNDLASLGFAIAIGLFVLPHEIGTATIKRGLSDNNRIMGHWLPAVKMSSNSSATQVESSSSATLLIGHGYGRQIWDTFHDHCDNCAYKGPGLGGPHNVFLQALFVGGLAAMVSLIWLFAELGRLLWGCRIHQDETLNILALGGLVAFAGFFLISGQVGDPRPEPLAILMLFAMLLHRDMSTTRLSPVQ
jgi:hypothetical protein